MNITPILSQTTRNLRQTLGSQITTLATVSLSVLIFAFFCLVFFNLRQAGVQFGEYIKLIVYLNEEPSAAERAMLEQRIREFSPVERIVFKSRQDAFEQLSRQLGPDRDLLADLNPDFLPPSIEVYPTKNLKALSRIKAFSDFLLTLPKAKKVQYGREWIERLATLTQLVRMIVYLSGGILILTSTFMVSSTISLTVAARQGELAILRLLGADSAYIRVPLLLEGLLQGVLGPGLGLCCLYLMFFWIKGHFHGHSLLDTIAFSFLPAPLVLIIFLASILLCTAGSLISIRKALRV